MNAWPSVKHQGCHLCGVPYLFDNIDSCFSVLYGTDCSSLYVRTRAYRLNDQRIVVRFTVGRRGLYFTKVSRLDLELTQCVLGDGPFPGFAAYHPHPPSVQVKNVRSYIFTPPCVCGRAV